MLRCPCRSLSHIPMYAPSLSSAGALPGAKNPAQNLLFGFLQDSVAA
jgi:hypothetical protein